MTSDCYHRQVHGLIRSVLPLVLLLAGNMTASAACNESITSGNATGQVGLAFTYPIVATGNVRSYNATGLPAGLIVDTNTGIISGTPTTAGTYSVTLQATYTGQCGTISKVVTFTINSPSLVGFRLPDFLTSASSPNNPKLMLQMGGNGTSTTANRFNATLEVNAGSALTPSWVPYNHFVGVNDSASWITDAPLALRDSANLTGAPQAFGTGQLTQSPPAVYMKADPRATRFGIFQMDTVLTTTKSRLVLPLWPSPTDYSTVTTVPNGFGGTVGTDVEHVPNRFSSAAYYPATFAINTSVTDARDTATTTYSDNDAVIRPADAIYPGGATTTGSSTPYYTTSTSYHPIMLNRPFRNVAELGYAFRDLPWKTLDFFSDKSADASLLDIFAVNDGPALFDSNGNFTGMGALPTMVAGSVNLNTTRAADLQSVLGGAILDELNSNTKISNTGTGPDNQAVKARREVVARAASTVSQTRVWNVVIDVVAQSGHFKPNAGNLQSDFVVEGEQHYWVHVAIDRFTGQVLDKQIEVVNE